MSERWFFIYTCCLLYITAGLVVELVKYIKNEPVAIFSAWVSLMCLAFVITHFMFH